MPLAVEVDAGERFSLVVAFVPAVLRGDTLVHLTIPIHFDFSPNGFICA
jgi:hypothetical protein